MKWHCLVRISLSILVVLHLTACGDPGGPAISGTLTLGSSVRASEFRSLQVRAYPDSAAQFEPSSVLSDPINSASEPLDSVVFPFRYHLGGGVGVSDAQRWRLVAWLSHSSSPDKPDSGDVFCTARFSLRSCGAYGGYCGETRDVDCLLELTVP